jgi:hypothetical protein
VRLRTTSHFKRGISRGSMGNIPIGGSGGYRRIMIAEGCRLQGEDHALALIRMRPDASKRPLNSASIG